MKTTSRILIAVIALALPCIASAQDATPSLNLKSAAPYLALIAGNVADLVTTKQAFDRGAVEGNHLTGEGGTQHLAPLLAEKAAETVFAMWGMRYFAHRGHPRIAQAIGFAAGGLTLTIAAHNATVAR